MYSQPLLNDDTQFHKQQFFRFPEGFSDTADTSGTEQIHRFTDWRSCHVKWTTRALDVDSDRAAEVIEGVRDRLSDPIELPLLVEAPIYRGRKAYMLNSGLVKLVPHDPSDVSVCPKFHMESYETIYDGEEPVVEADFFYEPAGRPQPLVVFVDGPDHQKEHVQAKRRGKAPEIATDELSVFERLVAERSSRPLGTDL